MLVLTRKRNESIKIGNDIVIKVMHIGHGVVKLGIQAPAHVRVLRSELLEFTKDRVLARGENGSSAMAKTIDDADSVLEIHDDSHFDLDPTVEVEDLMLCVSAR